MIHYAVMNVCCSFIPACTLDWDYSDAERTTNEEEVTCEKCLQFLKEADEINIEEDLECNSIEETVSFTKERFTSS